MRAGHVVAACLGAVVLVAWWFLPFVGEGPRTSPQPPPDAASTTAPAAIAELATKPASTAMHEREVVAGEDPAGELAAGCWRLQLKVVDAFGEPVEGARVQLHHEQQGSAFMTLASDVAGLCSSAVREDVVWVRAEHEDVGRSTLLDVHAAMVEPGKPTRLLLLHPVVVRGLVLDANAMPMVGAKLIVGGRLWVDRGYPGPCVPNAPVVTDGGGRFAFEAVAGASCSVSILDDGRGTAKTTFEAGPGTDLLLAVAGAFGISGMVKDASSPVAKARLQLVGDGGRPQEPQSQPDGTFTIPLSGPGEFFVSATTPTMASVPCGVQLTVDRPRAVVDLVLEPLLETRGRVVTPDGSAPRTRVMATLDPVVPAMHPRQRDIWLASDFVLRLPRDSRWRVTGTGISPTTLRAGDQDVCVAWRDASAPDSAPPVMATVLEVYDVHGAPVRSAKAFWRRLQTVATRGPSPPPETAPGDAAFGGPAGSWDANRLQLTANQMRTSPWFLVVQDTSLATAHIDFAAADTGGTMRVNLQPAASLTVRVQHRGNALRGVDLLLEPCGEQLHQSPDGDGRVDFAVVPSGPALVQVRRGLELLVSRQIELHPSQRESLTIDVDL